MGDDFWTAHFLSEAVIFTTLASTICSKFPAAGIHSDDIDISLRFCMGLKPKCDKEELVTRREFMDFLRRFGPIEVCLRRAVQGVLRDGLPAKWFHPGIGRPEAEALLCNSSPGSFLVRYSGSKDALCISYSLVLNDLHTETSIRHVLFSLRGDKGYTLNTPTLRLPNFDGFASTRDGKSQPSSDTNFFSDSTRVSGVLRHAPTSGIAGHWFKKLYSTDPHTIPSRVRCLLVSENGKNATGNDHYMCNYPEDEKIWESISDFINENQCVFIHPIESHLSTLFLEEVKLHGKWRDFGTARELAAQGEAETALAKTDQLLECPDDGDSWLWLRAKVYLLRGDTLASLGKETAAIMSYRDVIRICEERVKQTALTINGDSVLRQYGPVLSKSHKCLASYYLRNQEETTTIEGCRRIPLGLLHSSLDVASTTELKARREVRKSWSTDEAFQSILDEQGWGPETVAELQANAIQEWHGSNLQSAREKFGEALVQARCLGLDMLETKILGNIAAVSSMDGQCPEAVSQYMTCLHILRGLRADETYRKVLNFLVITLMHACAWNVAQKYNDELIALSESKEDLDMLMSRRANMVPSQSSTETQESV